MSDNNKFSVAADQYISLDGQITNIKNKIRLGFTNRCPYDPELIAKALQDIVEGRFHNTAVNKILRLISSEEHLTINAVDGKQTIAKAKDVFKSYIDDDFKNWGTDEKSSATEETAVNVYEMISDANFSQMFNSLSTDLDKMCLTQSQIINFCVKHPSWLRQNGNATFFLFKVSGEYFVARVRVGLDGLDVYVSRFEDDRVWGSLSAHRIVTPQLAS